MVMSSRELDANGFVTADSYAVGQSYEQTTTYTRDGHTELIEAKPIRWSGSTATVTIPRVLTVSPGPTATYAV